MKLEDLYEARIAVKTQEQQLGQWLPLILFILDQIKAIFFRKDGRPRPKGLIRKAQLLLFALKLASHIIKVVKSNGKGKI